MSEEQITRVGVIGLGTMGAGIVEVFARKGVQVVGVELDDAALERGRARLEGSTGRAVKRAKMTQEQADAVHAVISYAGSLDALADVDLVVEAIPERMELKHDLFARLDAIVGPRCILATNTSSLSVTDIAVRTSDPSRVVGMHFFNPAPVQRLVEVITTVVTDSAVASAVAALAARLGKTPVVATDRAGFIANSLLIAYLNSAVRLLETGRGSREDIDTAVRLGLGYPMGPFALMDLIGLDTCYQVLVTMYDQTRDPLHAPAPLLGRLVAAGRLGRKTGAGFYTYDAAGRDVVPDDRTPAQPATGTDGATLVPAEDVHGTDPTRVGRRDIGDELTEIVRGPLTSTDAVAAACAQVRAQGRAPVVTTPHAGGIVDTLLLPYLNDALRLVEVGYASADDVDTAMTNGCALPQGPIAVADDLGLDVVLARQEAIAAETAQPGHAPTPLLRQLVASGRTRYRS